MALPVIRRYTLGVPSALNTFSNLTDDLTGQAQFLILGQNTLQDMVNDPDPLGRYEFVLLKNGNQTPVRAFSSTISPTTQGRIPLGPISLSAGQYIFSGQQTSGALAATSIVVRYAAPLN